MELMKTKIKNSLDQTLTESRISDLNAIFDFTKMLYLYNAYTISTDLVMDDIVEYIYKNDQDITLDFIYRLKYNIFLNDCEDALNIINTVNYDEHDFLKSKYIDKTLSDIVTNRAESSDNLTELIVVLRLNINYVINKITILLEDEHVK